MKKRGLGKGLDAIFAENSIENRNSAVTIRIGEIERNKDQPRKDFNEESLQELADSIAVHGILQPLLVRPLSNGGYQIVAGERRWRAARMAGLTEVPAVVRELSDSEMAEIALVENLQREDLNPLEEAEGYGFLIDTYGLTQEEIAKAVGKSRPAVTNALRLLGLPQEVRAALAEGKISAGHARALLAFSSEGAMLETLALIDGKGLSVRDVEKMARAEKTEKPVRRVEKTTFMKETELVLKNRLGRKVSVSGSGKKGTIQIDFYGEDDLKELIKRLNLE